LVSELRLTAGCVLMDLASPAVSGTSVYANGLRSYFFDVYKDFNNQNCTDFPKFSEQYQNSRQQTGNKRQVPY